MYLLIVNNFYFSFLLLNYMLNHPILSKWHYNKSYIKIGPSMFFHVIFRVITNTVLYRYFWKRFLRLIFQFDTNRKSHYLILVVNFTQTIGSGIFFSFNTENVGMVPQQCYLPVLSTSLSFIRVTTKERLPS